MSRNSTDIIGVVTRVGRVMYSGIADGHTEGSPKVKTEKARPMTGLSGMGVQDVVSNLNELSKKNFTKADVPNANAGVYFLILNTSR